MVTPAEVCKIRMQSETNRQFRNVAHVAYSIVREEGLAALYKGVIPTMFRQGCNQAVNFTAYNAIKTRVLQQEGRNELASWQAMLIGGFSGGMGPLVNNPVSVQQYPLPHLSRDSIDHTNWCFCRYLIRFNPIQLSGGRGQDSTPKEGRIGKSSTEIHRIGASMLCDCKGGRCCFTLEGNHAETPSHHAGPSHYIYDI